jgi:hypothetical protein
MCIDMRRAPDAPTDLGHERGLALPLFRSASAKAILAFLPAQRLLQIYRVDKAEIRNAGLAQNWQTFKGKLRLVRRAGYAEAHGELIAGLVGIAVPVFNVDNDVLGSLAFVVPESQLNAKRKEFLVSALRLAATRIHESLKRLAIGWSSVHAASGDCPRRGIDHRHRKAQTRLTARYRMLIARGKRTTVVCTAIARELVGFMWAVARQAHAT